VAEITGSVAVTADSAAITFAVAPAASVAGRRFFVDSDTTGTVYRILTHTATSTAATLDSNFLGLTNLAAAMHVIKDEYDLPANFLGPIHRHSLQGPVTPGHLLWISQEEMEAMSPTLARGGWPRYVAVVADRKARIRPWPIEARRYEVTYIAHPGTLTFTGTAPTDSLNIYPPEYGEAVGLLACADLFIDKDDDRARAFFDLAMNDGRDGGALGVLPQMVRWALRQTRPRTYIRPGQSVSTRR
jgi:hypothetical protein